MSGPRAALRDRLSERAHRVGAGRPRPMIPHRGWILGGAGVVLFAAILVWLLAFSPVFGVRTVTVRGAQQLSAGQVRQAAAIESGTPLLRLDSASVARRVERLPDVASARVGTSFPSTVVITITERTAVGYVKSANAATSGGDAGSYVLVDSTGYQFRTVRAKPAKLPLLVVPKGADSRTAGGAVARVAAALPHSLLHHVASIQALDPDAITLLLTDDRVVRWGTAAHSAEKARVLPALLRQPGTEFDVTDPNLPFAR